MKHRILFTILIILCLPVFAGCSCRHVWEEADCLTPKTCTECQETEGEPLGHTPGEWVEAIDPVTCTAVREQFCSVCNEQTGSETVPLRSAVRDDLFVFTPKEFMERLALIAEQHAVGLTYEFVPGSSVLQVMADSNGKQSIIQFFGSSTAPLTSDEKDAAALWCISLTAIGESDADFRLCFFMACDPALDREAAFDTDMHLSTEFLNASANGEPFGYHQQNHLLYETTYIPEGALGQDYAVSMVNIYASDFR